MSDPWNDPEVAREAYTAAWALFKALETEDFDLANEIAGNWEPMDLQRGLTLVAAVLRESLREHAETIGCDCGSDDWVEQRVLGAALPPDHPDKAKEDDD